MRDIVIFTALVVTFAIAVTTHVLIFAGLLARRRAGLAASSVVVPPLAPAWAIREGMTVRGAVWIVAVGGYVAAWLLSR